MSAPQVLRLQDYRTRRERRYEQALALYSADRERALLLSHLWSALHVTSADRAAVVWVDEYGAGLAHGHVVLDMVSDRPRRAFPMEPLQHAWSDGVPGLCDVASRESSPVLGEQGVRSSCVVALGSDGLRAWFLVADGQGPRPRLDERGIGEMMFLAGECSGILMHRDIPSAEDTVLVPEGGRERFAAWPILKDIEGYEKDEEVNRRISCRFLVTRVVRAILDDDLATDRDALEHQISCVRREIGSQFEGDPERQHWLAVLDASWGDDRVALTKAILGLGVHVENGVGHFAGARELYRSAYEAAIATGCEADALDAARYAARAWRRSSEWDRALAWYQVARGLAAAMEDKAKEALVLDGWAKVYKERGNLPRARQVLDEALVLALASGDRAAIGATYHDLSALASNARSPEETIRMGWKAVQHYPDEQDRLGALSDIALGLLEIGDLDAAEDAYAIVVRCTTSRLYRLPALSGFARIAGLRRNREEFERRLALLDRSGFSEGSAVFRSADWIARGEIYQGLDDPRQARSCFEKAFAIAKAHELGQFLIRAEDALAQTNEPKDRDTIDVELPAVSCDWMNEIRRELQVMREEAPVFAGV